MPVTAACECHPVCRGIVFNRLIVNLVRPTGFEMNVVPVRVANRRFIGAGACARIRLVLSSLVWRFVRGELKTKQLGAGHFHAEPRGFCRATANITTGLPLNDFA